MTAFLWKGSSSWGFCYPALRSSSGVWFTMLGCAPECTSSPTNTYSVSHTADTLSLCILLHCEIEKKTHYLHASLLSKPAAVNSPWTQCCYQPPVPQKHYISRLGECEKRSCLCPLIRSGGALSGKVKSSPRLKSSSFLPALYFYCHIWTARGAQGEQKQRWRWSLLLNEGIVWPDFICVSQTREEIKLRETN